MKKLNFLYPCIFFSFLNGDRQNHDFDKNTYLRQHTLALLLDSMPVATEWETVKLSVSHLTDRNLALFHLNMVNCECALCILTKILYSGRATVLNGATSIWTCIVAVVVDSPSEIRPCEMDDFLPQPPLGPSLVGTTPWWMFYDMRFSQY